MHVFYHILKKSEGIKDMAVIKCKMCGGNLNVTEGVSVAECEYCGTVQTVPSADNEKKLTLFSRANRLRMACEFDKAAGVYETIVAEFPTEAEAYWGLVLCKYGIEYVDDPATGKKVPTCHRSSFDSVMDDSDFEQACENADAVSRRVYRDEAKAIEEIRKGIVEVSGKEAPYDIFICYKEADEKGDRTIDSVIAQDVYDALTAKGYRVFFSRITLEDKLGTEYEPYIFAALNSAKIMLVLGSDYEYFNAVWVKNEWSRYLKLMAKDKSKHLIPCFKGVDAYDIPKEFQKFQAQDMGKVGAIQDLLRGIDKLLVGDRTSQTSYVQTDRASGPTASSLLRRGNIFLEDENWESADDYFNKVLDIEPECAEAYLGKFLSSCKLTSLEQFCDIYFNLDTSKDFVRAERFASSDLSCKLRNLRETIELKQLQLRLVNAIEWRYKSLVLAERLNAQRMRQKEEENQREELRLRLKSRRELIKPASKMLGCCSQLTSCIKTDGTVIALGSNEYGQRNIGGWTDIVSASIVPGHAVGLKSNGTVVATGSNNYGQCNVSRWSNIVDISAGGHHTVGLRADGTVVAVGKNEGGQCNVSGWSNIVAISASLSHTVGLRADGTAVATGVNSFGKCNVSYWSSIVDISAGHDHTVGLCADGTVVAVGQNALGACKVSDWSNIVDISAGNDHTVGLRADGTIVATGWNDYGQCNVSEWTDIVAIGTGGYHTVGVKSDGTLVATGLNKCGECNVEGIKLFDNYLTIEQERSVKMPKKTKEKVLELRDRIMWQINNLQVERDGLNREREGLGFFSGKRRREIDERLAQLDAEIANLKASMDGMVKYE